MYRPKPRIIGPGCKNENELSLKNLDKKAIFLNNNPRMRLAALSRLICPAPAVATRLKASEFLRHFALKVHRTRAIRTTGGGVPMCGATIRKNLFTERSPSWVHPASF